MNHQLLTKLPWPPLAPAEPSIGKLRELRDQQHLRVLLASGPGRFNSHPASETLADRIRQGTRTRLDDSHALESVLKAGGHCVVNTMAQMGISAIRAFRRAPIFEPVGFNRY